MIECVNDRVIKCWDNDKKVATIHLQQPPFLKEMKSIFFNTY